MTDRKFNMGIKLGLPTQSMNGKNYTTDTCNIDCIENLAALKRGKSEMHVNLALLSLIFFEKHIFLIILERE